MYTNSPIASLITPVHSEKLEETNFLMQESKTWTPLRHTAKVHQDTLEEKGSAYVSVWCGAVKEDWQSGRAGAEDLRTTLYMLVSFTSEEDQVFAMN